MNPSHTLDIEALNNETSAHALAPSDEDLMCAIELGDARALETLMGRYRGLLKSVILRIVHDHVTADDVLQECLIEIWKRAGHYCAAKGKPLGWMVTLAKRRAIDCLRRQISYSGAMDRLETASQHYIFIEDSDSEAADMASVLQQHIHRLPEPQQEVIRLAFLSGMSQREVAKATHTPLGTVKTRLELALKKLRVALRTQHRMHSLQAA
jgi:RNA polymerase sigma-70 factor, ECF subfamily